MYILGQWLVLVSTAYTDLKARKLRWRCVYGPATKWVSFGMQIPAVIFGGLVTIFILAVLVLADVIHMWI